MRKAECSAASISRTPCPARRLAASRAPGCSSQAVSCSARQRWAGVGEILQMKGPKDDADVAPLAGGGPQVERLLLSSVTGRRGGAVEITELQSPSQACHWSPAADRGRRAGRPQLIEGADHRALVEELADVSSVAVYGAVRRGVEVVDEQDIDVIELQPPPGCPRAERSTPSSRNNRSERAAPGVEKCDSGTRPPAGNPRSTRPILVERA